MMENAEIFRNVHLSNTLFYQPIAYQLDYIMLVMCAVLLGQRVVSY